MRRYLGEISLPFQTRPAEEILCDKFLRQQIFLSRGHHRDQAYRDWHRKKTTINYLDQVLCKPSQKQQFVRAHTSFIKPGFLMCLLVLIIFTIHQNTPSTQLKCFSRLLVCLVSVLLPSVAVCVCIYICLSVTVGVNSCAATPC